MSFRLLKPDIGATIQEQQFQQLNHDVHSKDREFQIDDAVFVENFGQGSKWLARIIDEVRGPLTYMVKLSDGRLVKRHVDHIRNRTSTKPSSSQNVIPLNDERLSFVPLLNSEESQPEQPPQSQNSSLYLSILQAVSVDLLTDFAPTPELKGEECSDSLTIYSACT